MLDQTPESLLDSKKIKPVNLKGDQPWIVTGRTDAEAEAPEFWSSDENRWLVSKVPDAGKDWEQKEKRALEDEMVGQHHWCNEHDLGQTPGDGERRGGLACYNPWDRRVRHDWAAEWQQCPTIRDKWSNYNPSIQTKGSPGGSVVKSMPAKQEVPSNWSLGQEDPLEKEMASHSTILAWKIPWAERSLVGYSPRGPKSQTQLSK